MKAEVPRSEFNEAVAGAYAAVVTKASVSHVLLHFAGQLLQRSIARRPQPDGAWWQRRGLQIDLVSL